MAHIDEVIQQLGARATADPNFAQQLRANPIAAAKSAGFQISPAELAEFMGLSQHNKSDDEIVEEFQSRLEPDPGTIGTKTDPIG